MEALLVVSLAMMMDVVRAEVMDSGSVGKMELSWVEILGKWMVAESAVYLAEK